MHGKNIYKSLNAKHLEAGLSATVHVIHVTKHVKLIRLIQLVAIVSLVLNLGMKNVRLFNVSPVGQIALNHVEVERLFVKFFKTAIMSPKNEDATNNYVQLT